MNLLIPAYIRSLVEDMHKYGHWAVARACFHKGVPIETVLVALQLLSRVNPKE